MSAKIETGLRLEKLKKFLPLLILCPYTRIIFLAGSVAENQAHSKSDIDLVVVAQHNRVWLNRFFLELVTWLVGQRRSETKINNRFCFNMFLSNSSPVLPHPDAVGASSYKNLQAAWYSHRSEVENFWHTNSWINKFCDDNKINREKIFETDFILTNNVRKILEFFFHFTSLAFLLEKISYKVQLAYLKKAFEKSDHKKSGLSDFFVTPNLAAYHFPVSNYSRALKKHQANLEGVDNPPLLKSNGEEHSYKI